MGNVPAKLDQDASSYTGRSTYTDSSSASGVGAFRGAGGTMDETRARGRRTSSLVGNILNGPTSSRNDPTGEVSKKQLSAAKKRGTKERELLKEENAKKLVIKYNETVDGGYLAPHGCYSLDKMDYDSDIVRKLIIERKLAPFYIPLQDFDDSWTKDEVKKIVDALPLHAPFNEHVEEYEDVPVGDLNEPHFDYLIDKKLSKKEQKKMHALIFKARLYRKRLRWQESENNAYLEEKLQNRDNDIPKNSFLPNDDLKYDLYAQGSECPICFLYLPMPLNYSKCCQQPICSECFVQIKRSEPHFPHDEVDPSQPQKDENEKDPNLLISEPANCPYCATPNFSITYTPPTGRKVGIGGQAPNLYKPLGTAGNAPPTYTVSSDDIRPDWETKLNKERVRLARRSANATAIHVSNRLIGPQRTGSFANEDSPGVAGSTDSRSAGVANSTLEELEKQMIDEAIRLSLQDEKRKAKR
ncbi:uncharacterized protein GVI51_I00649 [Nakaseomyces glabratus]|uniref:Protein SIP5 n=1 Tax=Candida glabrata (strain ATCC 2001 / BCRC 20586 / JCM 3761 / NBRC 0622 / NRRL Y-65 / CBS 138) TaxID=284593 RepID=SIP5_CANGA|nr:uncharacterized protein CAGL0I00836g [Nakaseomyces glabratus]Q6FR54.1 RecName: Full=Protein SIP5 [Nakaseomyces glabratus CBS 138]KAH7599546.1 hypothetical protein J7294_02561 [Nakaseomyces glabratus]KAH7604377.1 hypothetical protein J7293_02551 [Nakaseomyces glabratus]QHS66935.1 uncharacterized protein GVI51_I00649 [Nakaseomyces glabratus]CAG60227.1 unnamed protein product [Nakaseomyces glabratus]|eukprot:XP_447290.1 uncharacterized protein CAGL0I00836g [[Candida] glabrata]